MDGIVGEVDARSVVAAPLTLAFGENGGFIYVKSADPDGLPNPAVATYRYSPRLSPAHGLIIQADRDAITEVARQEGISPDEVLERARQRKADAKSGPSPLQMFFEEAERLGTTPGALLNEGFDTTTLYVPEGARK